MVLDSLSNSAKYEGLHPAFKQVFDYIKSTDFSKLETGRIELDGDNAFINYVELTGKAVDAVKMETHKDYLDIHVPLTAVEAMGWIPTGDLKEPEGEYNAEYDIAFFQDKATTLVNIHPGQFAIVFPEDGHQPAIAEGVVFRKLIVKVKI